MQVICPTVEPHAIDFPAAVAAAPAVALIVEIWLGGNESVHWSPAGTVLPAVNERLSEVVVPGFAIADERLRLGVCAKARPNGQNIGKMIARRLEKVRL